MERQDMEELVLCAKEELYRIGIETGDIIEVRISDKDTMYWGRCFKKPDGYIIEISYKLLKFDSDSKELLNTVYHELLHTCPGCMNHKALWKEKASRVNYLFGLNIKRCSSAEEMGFTRKEVVRSKTYHYALKCTCCGNTVYRTKCSTACKHPEFYRCARCNGSLICINLDI